MSLSISNLAFPSGDYEGSLKYLEDVKIRNIDISPYKHFGGWREVEEISKSFRTSGFNIVSMQSLFYNIDANIFLTTERFINHFIYVSNLAKVVGCKYLVFGSPKARSVVGCNQTQIREKYSIFNSTMDQIIAKTKETEVVIGLEMNSPQYGCDFFNSVDELGNFQFGKRCKFHFDLGCVRMIDKDPFSVVEQNIDKIDNIHVSEPFMMDLLSTDFNHKSFSRHLANIGFSGYISLEIKEQDLSNFKRSVDRFIDSYSLHME